MLGVFWKIQEICNKMGTRICKIVEEMSEIIEHKVGNPKNFSQSTEIKPLSATPEILLFLRMRFSNIFFTYMVWNYQNEIAPIFYYGISKKTNEKDLKIPSLQPSDWKNLYWMSLYLNITFLNLFWKYFIRNISKYLGAADLSIATAVSSRLQNAE